MDRIKAKKRMQESEEAEMGVGTLIVFIAMIIVAAVAATVLITTAFEMQQQAEHTAQIAQADIATGFKIVNVAGDRVDADAFAGNETTIQVLEIKVGLMAGSPAIKVDDVIIEISDGLVDVSMTYVHAVNNYNSTANADEFTCEQLRDMAPTNESVTEAVMTSGDLAKFYIDVNTAGLKLSTQTTCTVKIIPKHGIPTLETFTTPPVYTTRFINL